MEIDIRTQFHVPRICYDVILLLYHPSIIGNLFHNISLTFEKQNQPMLHRIHLLFTILIVTANL